MNIGNRINLDADTNVGNKLGRSDNGRVDSTVDDEVGSGNGNFFFKKLYIKLFPGMA